jgi:2-polyprenyl-6-methoxyphenol hydroxylase-like FAD-dependent oxidoreductase
MSNSLGHSHVEIAGLGLAGLSAACAFAKAGWSVRIHERAEEVRLSGAGIYVAENGARVLDALGASEEAFRGAYQIHHRDSRDSANRTLAIDDYPREKPFRAYFLRRETLVYSLLNVAKELGVEVRLGSHVLGATPDGALHLVGGETLAADVIVGADGINSQVRKSIGVETLRTELLQGAHRAVCRRPQDAHIVQPHTFIEWWAGARRFFYAPVSTDLAYLVMTAQLNDEAGSRNPFDKQDWCRTFPFTAEIIANIEETVPFMPFVEIRCKSWIAGRVALVGDAAHAMSPNLGQGGGTAMMDGISLAHNVVNSGLPVEAALCRWQERQRPIVDRAQCISGLYSKLASWPDTPRKMALWCASKSGWITRQRLATANFLPDGV